MQKMIEITIAFQLSIEERSTGYFLALITRVALPSILRFKDQRMSWVRMPASIGGIPIAVWKRPVTAPAIAPAINAAIMQRKMFTPWVRSAARTHAPVHTEPSTVRSAISSIL